MSAQVAEARNGYPIDGRPSPIAFSSKGVTLLCQDEINVGLER